MIAPFITALRLFYYPRPRVGHYHDGHTGRSRKGMAKRIGISHRTWESWENGASVPEAYHLELLWRLSLGMEGRPDWEAVVAAAHLTRVDLAAKRRRWQW